MSPILPRRVARRAVLVLASSASAAALAACNDTVRTPDGPRVQFRDHSATPTFVKASSLPAGVQVYSLVGSDDRLAASPGFVFGGSADGAGVIPDPSGSGYTILLNHEDNFAVSRIRLDATFKPVSGDYVVSSAQGQWRLCSATMATAEHGFARPVFFTVGESGIESQIHAVDPAAGPDQSRLVPAFGYWNSENALPLPQAAFPNRTIVVIGDDDSGRNGGQVAMYLADRAGDITTGKLHVPARTDNVTRERDMVPGRTYAVEFREVPAGPSGAAI
jgi:hypothetical protein